MVTTSTDISIVLSGGSSNSNPNLSLGGSPSSTPITNNSINNLFDDISAAQLDAGRIDYRCFYIFNDGDSPIYSCKLWVAEEVSNGASILLGVKTTSELQRISISTIPNSGSITLSYEGEQFTVSYDSDTSAWAIALENALNNLTDGTYSLLKQVQVTAQLLSDQVVFDINFGGNSSLNGNGQDDKKNHATIQYVSDTFDTDSEVTVSVLQEGGPVNVIAESLDTTTVAPNGVSFSKPTESTPFTLPRLLPTEGFAIWAQRTVTTSSTSVENDGFTFAFRSNSLNPYT